MILYIFIASVAIFSLVGIVASVCALLARACDTRVHLYFYVVSIAYAMELGLCVLYGTVTWIVKRSTGHYWDNRWKTLCDKILYYCLLSLISIFLHLAWLIWGSVATASIM